MRNVGINFWMVLCGLIVPPIVGHTRFTPFHLVYDQEALQPIELEIPTTRAIECEGKIEGEIVVDECVKCVLLDNKCSLSIECFEQRL